MDQKTNIAKLPQQAPGQIIAAFWQMILSHRVECEWRSAAVLENRFREKSFRDQRSANAVLNEDVARSVFARRSAHGYREESYARRRRPPRGKVVLWQFERAPKCRPGQCLRWGFPGISQNFPF
jgi:hypothetical protein